MTKRGNLQRHLQNISILGVWMPLGFLLSWVVAIMLFKKVFDEEDFAFGLALLGLVALFVLVPFIALASLVGAFLLLSRRAERVRLTILSSLVGAACSLPLLYALYTVLSQPFNL